MAKFDHPAATAKWEARNAVWDCIDRVEALRPFSGRAQLLGALKRVANMALWRR